eukprot:scaffold166885_cov32-Tisochrysis_lutea.AAC.1
MMASLLRLAQTHAARPQGSKSTHVLSPRSRSALRLRQRLRAPTFATAASQASSACVPPGSQL